jgi:carbamoyl-phosphate synthase large subunit
MNGMKQDGRAVRVLITGGGGSGTIEVLRALRATGEFFLITGDASPYSAGFAHADRAYVLPFGASPEFAPTIEDIVAREKPDFIIPLVDEEIPVVHRLASQGKLPGVRVVAPNPQFCLDCLDKWRMFSRLQAAGLPVAPTWLGSRADGAEYPAVVKPRTGRGSRGVAFLAGPADLERYLGQAAEGPERYVVQKRIFGREFTTSVVVALGGPTLAVVPKEVLVKKGITQVGVTRDVPEITRLGFAIQESLVADGPFNVQLVLDRAGVPYVFEINPRYSTTVALTLNAGIDEVQVVLRHALGQPVGELHYRPDLCMIRYGAQIYVPENEWTPIQMAEVTS